MSENSNYTKPLNANENVKWYRLGGKSKTAILRAIELNSKENNEIQKTEKKDIQGALGLKFLVARTDTYHGYSAHAPEVFASPYPNKNEFYMMCPIGDGRKDGKTSFIPDDAVELDEQEINNLTKGLFSPHGGSIPILHIEPTPLISEAYTPENNDIP